MLGSVMEDNFMRWIGEVFFASRDTLENPLLSFDSEVLLVALDGGNQEYKAL